MKPRTLGLAVFVSFILAAGGWRLALTTVLMVVIPAEILGRAFDRVSRRPRRSMTEVAGPSRFYPCTYCGRPADTWDHVIPRSRGGADDASNLVPCCTTDNSSKGDDTPEEWWGRIGRGAPYPSHWPRSAGFKWVS